MGSTSRPTTPLAGQTALTKLLSSELQPMSVLNDVIEMAQDSANLPAFADPEIVPSCMYMIYLYPSSKDDTPSRETALKKSSKSEPQKQESAYTLMCAQIIAISLQANLLGKDGLDEYLSMISGPSISGPLSTRGPEFLLAFGSHVSRVIYDKFSKASRILGQMYKNKNAPPTESVALPSLDSFGQINAEFLLLFLYQERDMILAARYGMPTCWQGWSVLLYQLWIYMRGVKLTNRMTVFLRDLICRFSIVSAGDVNEDNLLYLIEEHLKDTSGDGLDNERNCPVNDEDARVMVDAFINRFSGDSPPSMKFSIAILRWLLPGLNGKSRRMLPMVVEASLKRVWCAIDAVDALDNEQKGLIIEFTQNLFMDIQLFLSDKHVRKSDKATLVAILVKEEILQLAGRVMLLTSIGGLTKANLVLGKKIITLISARRECFQHTFKEFGKHYTPSVEEFYMWFRVIVHTRRLCAQHPLVPILLSAEQEWWDIGMSMGFTVLGGWPLCSWPRCPIPFGPVWFACDGCDIAGYCSRECQIAHWVDESPVNCHKQECPEMAKQCLKLNYQGKRQEIGKYDETWVKPKRSKQLSQSGTASSGSGTSSHFNTDDSDSSHSDSESSVCEV